MNVGDYVRTDKGNISKIKWISQQVINSKETKAGTFHLENGEIVHMYYGDAIKSNPQIIDLIEYMDMLYLKKPIKIYGTNKTVKLFNPVRCDGFTKYDDGTHCIILDLDHVVDVNDLEIEAVVTHEQMEAMQYRVEE